MQPVHSWFRLKGKHRFKTHKQYLGGKSTNNRAVYRGMVVALAYLVELTASSPQPGFDLLKEAYLVEAFVFHGHWTVRQYCLTIGWRWEAKFMTTLTITAKGQVTLKQELLNHLGVGPGEKIEADKLPDGRIVVRAAAAESTIDDFIGCLSRRGSRKLTVEEMNDIAARGWAKAK